MASVLTFEMCSHTNTTRNCHGSYGPRIPNIILKAFKVKPFVSLTLVRRLNLTVVRLRVFFVIFICLIEGRIRGMWGEREGKGRGKSDT